MKFSRQLVLSSLVVLVLTACSNSPTQRRQAKDDFTYLETADLQTWNLPEGATAQFYPNFDIPQGNFSGGIGQRGRHSSTTADFGIDPRRAL